MDVAKGVIEVATRGVGGADHPRTQAPAREYSRVGTEA